MTRKKCEHLWVLICRWTDSRRTYMDFYCQFCLEITNRYIENGQYSKLYPEKARK